jgi:two-component system, response regulator RegA
VRGVTQAPDASRRLLIVEDDAMFRERLAKAMRSRGFEVREADDAQAALDEARRETPDFAVVDLRLPGAEGLDVVRALGALEPRPVILVLTGYGSIATALEALRAGAAHYLTKPADADDVVAGLGLHAARAGRPAPAGVPTLARVEWEHINRVLQDCGGNVSKAARALGIHRRSLQRKLAKFPSPR